MVTNGSRKGTFNNLACSGWHTLMFRNPYFQMLKGFASIGSAAASARKLWDYWETIGILLGDYWETIGTTGRLLGCHPWWDYWDLSQGLLENESPVYGYNKNEITEMLSLTTKESIISFDMEFYSQIAGVAMGSPLGPTLTNAFLCHQERKWLNNCPNNFKPVFYNRYVDDIFGFFKKSEHVQLFVKLHEQ